MKKKLTINLEKELLKHDLSPKRKLELISQLSVDFDRLILRQYVQKKEQSIISFYYNPKKDKLLVLAI